MGVDADGQNLDPLLFRPCEKCFQLPELKRAVRSPIAAVKDQHHVLLAAITAEGNPLSVRVFQREIGRFISNLDPFEIGCGQTCSVFRAELAIRGRAEKQHEGEANPDNYPLHKTSLRDFIWDHALVSI
jgi:hypothetical protein